MNNQAQLILQQCIRDYGTTIGREPQRLEALLKDYAKGQHKREIFVIVQAAKENVVEQLLHNTAPLELIAGTLAHQLTEDYGIDRGLADWAIESWLFALNLGRPTNKVKTVQLATTSVAANSKTDSNPVTSIKSAETKVNNTALIDERYLDNGDGTVTDQQTGLQWMRCSLGQRWNRQGCQGNTERYTWDQAKNISGNFSFSGYNDWRLPTIDELKSIIEKNKSPSINHRAFPITPKWFFWSSSPVAWHSHDAWGVFFRNGYVLNDPKTNFYRVRLARGEQYPAPKPVASIKSAETKVNNTALTDGRYLDNGDGTVTDQQTGLQWMRCSLGQRWNRQGCQGNAERYTWDQAKNISGNFSFSGYNDWRLPTIDELKSIIEKNKSPSINHRAFPITPKWFFWSSSPVASISDYAWFVNFGDGYVVSSNKTFNSHVRLVRSGQ